MLLINSVIMDLKSVFTPILSYWDKKPSLPPGNVRPLFFKIPIIIFENIYNDITF